MTQNPDTIHESVREHYAERIKNSASCCGSDACCSPQGSLYPADLLTTLPADISSTSYGCGDRSRLRVCSPVKPCSILAPAQDWIVSSPPKKSAQREKQSAWI